MTMRGDLDDRGDTLTVCIPLRIRKRGGRKLMIAPDGAGAWPPPRARVDNALVKAVARAHRWRRLLESGEYATITELAAAEKINQSYVCRILRLTLLAPDVTESILDGRQPAELDLDSLLKPLPGDWAAQANVLLKNRAVRQRPRRPSKVI
ncbi:hypothetical protein [Pseudorhodoplanes sinuspersici]|nr:hypothetical protein [Pseudorhodoplanes sinuspersici]RKE68090.1 hypothetical protein DFP91_4447 [Pseudorhodoplanes sinuspersici]